MPRPASRLLPAAYALLGCLAEGAAHGYDLHRQFVAGAPLAEVLRLEMNQLYALLKKLAAQGLLDAGTAEATGTGPPRRLFAITPAGAATLAAWLAEPVRHTREMRLEFLLKLYFARRQAPDQVPALLAAQVAVTRARARRLEQEAAALASRPAADFSRQVVDLRLRQNQAVLAWLEETLGAPPAPPSLPDAGRA